MKKLKQILNHIFIDGLSGMALGLFCTLIIGTIIKQIGTELGGDIGTYLTAIGIMAQLLTGAGIGVGVAVKFKTSPLVAISAAACGFIGAQATVIIKAIDAFNVAEGADKALKIGIAGPGEPLGAFIAALIGIEIGRLIAGKTKLDIILTPMLTILTGAAAGLLVGPPISDAMKAVGKLINWGADRQPFLMGIIVAVLMGIALTLPISSAAIGISLGLTGIAAGAATVGCSAQMIGFAVMSYRENKMGGLLAQGVGTSMIQMPNIIKKPIIWLPPIIASAILGPISTLVFKMKNTSIGSGMGTSGLVGQLETFAAMPASAVLLLEVILLHFVIPALLCLLMSEFMRKKNWIQYGDMKLDV